MTVPEPLFSILKTCSFSQRKSDPVITVYETQANLADHERIQGTDGNFSTTSS
jgi:hypothetical protein